MPSAPTLDVAVALQALERHGHGRRRNLKPMGQHGGNHLTPFGLGFEDGFQVIFFRSVDGVFHGCTANKFIR